MKWIKDYIVDIAVIILIIIAVLLDKNWLEVVIISYSSLMLFLKIVVFINDSFLIGSAKKKSKAPPWFIHLLYAINVIVLFSFQWWVTGAEWCLIWLFSWLVRRKLDQKVTTKGKRKRKK